MPVGQMAPHEGAMAGDRFSVRDDMRERVQLSAADADGMTLDSGPDGDRDRAGGERRHGTLPGGRGPGREAVIRRRTGSGHRSKRLPALYQRQRYASRVSPER